MPQPTYDEQMEDMRDILQNLAAVKGKEFAMLAALLHAANVLNTRARGLLRSTGSQQAREALMHRYISDVCTNYVDNARAAYGMDRATIDDACEWATRLSARVGIDVYKNPNQTKKP